MSYIRKYNLLIILFIFAVLFSAKAFASLPDITKALEPKMHTGSAEEILAFIKERDTQVTQLANELQSLSKKTRNLEEKEIVTNALDIFQALPVQYKRLESELKKTAYHRIRLSKLSLNTDVRHYGSRQTKC